MSISPITAAKFDVFIAAEEHLTNLRLAGASFRKLAIAQRAYDAAKANLTVDEIAQLEAVSGEKIA